MLLRLIDSTTAENEGDCAPSIVLESAIGQEILRFESSSGRLADPILARLRGCENLEVRLESSRIGFFLCDWEKTWLSEALAAGEVGIRAISRVFCGPEFPDYQVEYQFDLPLRILCIASRPAKRQLPYRFGDSVNLSLRAWDAGQACAIEARGGMTWERLRARLKDRNQPVHGLQYCGPLVWDHEEWAIEMQDAGRGACLIPVNRLFDALVEHKVALFAIDSRAYLKPEGEYPARAGLAEIARCAKARGLGNVIGLGEIVDPWTAMACFESIYAKLGAGIALELAVVQTRNEKKPLPGMERMALGEAAAEIDFSLQHYGKQSIQFLKSPGSAPGEHAAGESTSWRRKIFGFKSEMLPPILVHVGESACLEAQEYLEAAAPGNRILRVMGSSGSGKTHLAHVVCLLLVQGNRIDFGFYFDFREYLYSPDEILQMVAGPLQVTGGSEGVLHKIDQRCCLFIFDNADALFAGTDDASLVDCAKPMEILIGDLIKRDQMVMLLAANDPGLLAPSCPSLEIPALTLPEQRLLAGRIQENTGLEEAQKASVFRDSHWNQWLLNLKGNAWLTKKSARLSMLHSCQSLIQERQARALSGSEEPASYGFYRWQWDGLSPFRKRLLLLCSDVPGLMLEMLMGVCDRKDPFEPAAKLFALLGEATAKMADAIEAWETSGFLLRFPHARVVDPDSLPFLRTTNRSRLFEEMEAGRLSMLFSQTVCEGIRILGSHVLRDPNPSVANNLLINRWHWVKQMERLWFGGDYRGFFSAKSALDPLLQQAKLIGESRDWALDLLERSHVAARPFESQTPNPDASVATAWLALAGSALEESEAVKGGSLRRGADSWGEWLKSLPDSVGKEDLALFRQAVTFLERYHRSQGAWNECVAVCEKAMKVYIDYESWFRAIEAMKSLARYWHSLGDAAKALEYEGKILSDLPYEDAPAGFKTRQQMEILWARITRSALGEAQSLLDGIRQSKVSEIHSEMLESAQCDIHYRGGAYPAALPYLCKAWSRALQYGEERAIIPLRERLLELERKLGAGQFQKQFEMAVPEGTLKPGQYSTSIG